MDENWLYHYDPQTKQQSLDWRHSGSPTTKILSKKSAGKVLASIFFLGGGIKTASSSLIIFQRATLSTRFITHLCRCNWRNFERNTPPEVHQGGPVLARQCSCSPDTCNPEKTGLPELPIPWSPTPFCGSGPVGLPPVPWTEINN
jgi:hypothetical protein